MQAMQPSRAAAHALCALFALHFLSVADATVDISAHRRQFRDFNNFATSHLGPGNLRRDPLLELEQQILGQSLLQRQQTLTHHLDAAAQVLAQGPAVGIAQDPTAETTHTSWFARFGNAMWSVFIGFFVVIPFAVALLWVNERRNAQLESLISLGQSEAVTIETTQVDLIDYDGTLVHLDSEIAKGLESVQDSRFASVQMERGCIKLKSSVEVYQWHEDQKQETKKDSVGGGTTTTTTYTYRKAWSESAINSSSFRKNDEHRNIVHVQGLDAGSKEVANRNVKYGEPYWLPPDLVQQLNNFQDAAKLVGDKLTFGSYTFTGTGAGWFHCPVRSDEPEIGDFRVKFEYVLDGPASILALQMKHERHEGGRTFGPYRAAARSLCGGTTNIELKALRLDTAKKDADELYEEQRCSRQCDCFCCCCNLVTYCFASVLVPQIYSIWPGQKSKVHCLNSEKTAGILAKWLLRVLGWLLLWIGFAMLFGPLEVVLDIVPFLGPYLGTGTAYLVGFVTFLLTMVLSTLIISLAHLLYHPMLGVLYLLLTAGMIASIALLAHACAATQAV